MVGNRPPGLGCAATDRVFAEDGTWLDSRDSVDDQRGAWPGSFSLTRRGESGSALVRLRAYRRDGCRLLGERSAGAHRRGSRRAGTAANAGDGQPAPPSSGVDVTPAREPNPALAIDRLVEFPRLRHAGSAEVDAARSLLRNMADLQRARRAREPRLSRHSTQENSTDMSVTGRATNSAMRRTAPCARRLAPRGGRRVYRCSTRRSAVGQLFCWVVTHS